MSISQFEIVEVPRTKLRDGRDFLPDAAIATEPAAASFVCRLSNYWQYDIHLQGYRSPEDLA